MTTHGLQMRTATPVIPSWPIAAAGLLGAALVGLLVAVAPQLGLGALLFLCFVPLVLLELVIAIAIWVPLAFVERLPQLVFAPTLAAIMVFVAWLGAVSGAPRLVSDFARRQPVLLGSLALLLAWVTASVAWADDVGAMLYDFWRWWVAAGVLIVVATAARREIHARLIAGAFIAGAVVSVVAGLVVGFADANSIATQEDGRFGGGLGDPNLLAAGLVPAIALAAGLYPGSSPRVRVSLVAAILILSAGLAASGSRGGLFAALVSIVAALALSRGRRLQLGALIVTAVVFAGAFVATSSPSTWERVRSFDSGGTGRIDLWTVAWRMSEEHPVTGVGVNNFRSESSEYVLQPGSIDEAGLIVGRPHVVHNVYLQLLAETGIVGLALFAVVIGAAVSATWRAAARLAAAGEERAAALARAILIAQLGALSASVFLSNGYDKRIWLLFALGCVMLGIAERRTPQVST